MEHQVNNGMGKHIFGGISILHPFTLRAANLMIFGPAFPKILASECMILSAKIQH